MKNDREGFGMKKGVLIDRIEGKAWQDALPDAEKVMNVYRHPDARSYFLGSLRMRKSVFWDEVDKNRLLYRLQEIAEQKGYLVHTFSFLNDEIQLLMSKDRDYLEQESFIDTLSASYNAYFREKGVSHENLVREHSSWNELHGNEEILDTCYKIHSKPERLGYIGNGGKHFWSGELQYDMRYCWSFLDMSGILGLLSDDPVHAYTIFNMDQKDRKRRENKKQSN